MHKVFDFLYISSTSRRANVPPGGMNGQDRDRQHLLPKASPFGTRGLAHNKGRPPKRAAGPRAGAQALFLVWWARQDYSAETSSTP